MDDELENTFLRFTALDVPLIIHIDEKTIVTVAEVHHCSIWLSGTWNRIRDTVHGFSCHSYRARSNCFSFRTCFLSIWVTENKVSLNVRLDINWNELEQIEIDDELENTFLRLTALDVPLNIRIDENTIVTVANVHQIYDNMYGLFTFTTEIAFKGKTKVVPSIRSSTCRRGLNVISGH
jgi:hypothetical protein